MFVFCHHPCHHPCPSRAFYTSSCKRRKVGPADLHKSVSGRVPNASVTSPLQCDGARLGPNKVKPALGASVVLNHHNGHPTRRDVDDAPFVNVNAGRGDGCPHPCRHILPRSPVSARRGPLWLCVLRGLHERGTVCVLCVQDHAVLFVSVLQISSIAQRAHLVDGLGRSARVRTGGITNGHASSTGNYTTLTTGLP